MLSTEPGAGQTAILFSGGVGALVAVIADIVQKEDTGAVLKIAAVCNKYFLLNWSTLWFALSLIVLGVVLCFVFDPTNKKLAFSTGAGIIALIMTAVPISKPPTLPGSTLSGATGAKLTSPSRHFADVGARFVQFNVTGLLALTVNITISDLEQFPKQPTIVTAVLHEANSDKTWELLRGFIEPGKKITFSTEIMRGIAGAPQLYQLRVEAAGYETVVKTKSVEEGNLSFDVALTPTAKPAWLSRLLQVYGF